MYCVFYDVDMRMRTMMILFVMLMTIFAIMLCRIDDDDVMCYEQCQSFLKLNIV